MDRARYLDLFVREANRLLDDVDGRLVDATVLTAEAPSLMRALHTLKGMAATMTVPEMVLVAHAAEELCERLMAGSIPASEELFAILGEGADRLRLQVRGLAGNEEPITGEGYDARVRELLRTGGTFAFRLVVGGEEEPAPARLQAPDRLLAGAQGSIAEALSATRRLRGMVTGEARQEVDRVDAAVRELHEQLVVARSVRFSSIFPALRRHVRGVAARQGKGVTLNFTGDEVEVDDALLSRVLGPLTALLANAIVHGIEDEATRLEARKSRAGRLGVHAERVGNTLVLRVEDDGAGFDITLFEPGVSTVQDADEDAGRGVGLDAVRHLIEALAGSLVVDSSLGRGVRVRIVLPVRADLVSLHVVEVGGCVLGLRSALVEGGELPVGAPGLLDLVSEAPRSLRLIDSRIVGIDELLEEGEWVVSAPPFPLNRLSHIRGTSVAPDGRILLVVEP
ncbi:hypothetical protein LBMAG42_38360 [Deltaproteobacteria bacterium]|nr:hypothetical protein LBMAG42_38360 [Deltaproteobacteria bacterium]